MAATYSPAGHPRLSAAAKRLSPVALDAYAVEAEATLGIRGTSYTGQDAVDLALAVTRQVNRTIALEQRGDGLGDVESESKGDQSVSYSGTEQVDPLAKQIVDRVLTANQGGDVYRPGIISTPVEYTW